MSLSVWTAQSVKTALHRRQTGLRQNKDEGAARPDDRVRLYARFPADTVEKLGNWGAAKISLERI